jgi:hypothetical protein
MNRPILIGYQLLIGLSDTMTGALLMIAPADSCACTRLPMPCSTCLSSALLFSL